MDLKKLLPKGDLTPLNNRKGTEVGEMKKEKEKRRADCLWLFFCLLPRMRQRIKRQTSRQIPSSRETFGWWCCESGKNPGGRNGIRRSGAGSRAVTAAAAVPRSPHRCAWRLRATHSQQPLVLHPSPWGPAALQPAGCPHVKPPNVPTNPSPTHSGAWQTGLPTYIGWGAEGELISRPFRGGVARGFVPYCTDRVPAPSVWLSPRDPLQLPVYKKGEWISPGCQVCLTCGHGHCPKRQRHSWALCWCTGAVGQTAAELPRSCVGSPGSTAQLRSEKKKREAGKEVRKARTHQRLVCLHSLVAPPPLKSTWSSTQDVSGNRKIYYMLKTNRTEKHAAACSICSVPTEWIQL